MGSLPLETLPRLKVTGRSDGPSRVLRHCLIVMVRVETWIGLCSVLRPLQHSIGYMGDGSYRSKDPTNSITVLKEATKENNTKNKKNTKFTCIDTQKVDKYSIQV